MRTDYGLYLYSYVLYLAFYAFYTVFLKLLTATDSINTP